MTPQVMMHSEKRMKEIKTKLALLRVCRVRQVPQGLQGLQGLQGRFLCAMRFVCQWSRMHSTVSWVLWMVYWLLHTLAISVTQFQVLPLGSTIGITCATRPPRLVGSVSTPMEALLDVLGMAKPVRACAR